MEGREREFALVVERSGEALRHEIGYTPTRWTQMASRYGALNATRRWLAPGYDTSVELSMLATTSRLDQSIEWFTLVYSDLFDLEERQAAHRRLNLHDAPVDQWLRERLSRELP